MTQQFSIHYKRSFVMEKKVTIQKVFSILLHRLPLIILSGVLMALIFFVYTSVAIKPVYSTSAMIYVQNYGKRSADSTDDKEATGATTPTTSKKGSSSESDSVQSNNELAQKIFNSDLAGSSALASNCVILFQNDPKITEMYNGCTVNMSTVNNSFYIEVTVEGTDPQKCKVVADNVVKRCSEVFYKRFSYGSINGIRDAWVPTTPISPNKTRNTFIGAAIGILLACIISVLLELIDTTIKHDDDLSSMYKVPVFAEIPDFDSSGR